MDSIYFKVKDGINVDSRRVLLLFFNDSIESMCQDIVSASFYNEPSETEKDINLLKVDFVSQQDAIIVRLKGVPKQFQKYLEIVK